ncbi:MAG: hypothetical protein MI867_18205, partial [Pseudomonadales bacterium]|nr:hypothetical protein [Pseudomonadales bacterium]
MKYSDKWTTEEVKAGAGICPSEGDELPIDVRITKHVDGVAACLSGGPCLPAFQPLVAGQTTPFAAGSDDDVQAGTPLAYVDKGDGTITDENTELMWEKLDDNDIDSLHDQDAAWTWMGACDPVFETACSPGCTVTTCSCTKDNLVVVRYWSSTTRQHNS